MPLTCDGASLALLLVSLPEVANVTLGLLITGVDAVEVAETEADDVEEVLSDNETGADVGLFVSSASLIFGSSAAFLRSSTVGLLPAILIGLVEEEVVVAGVVVATGVATVVVLALSEPEGWRIARRCLNLTLVAIFLKIESNCDLQHAYKRIICQFHGVHFSAVGYWALQPDPLPPF